LGAALFELHKSSRAHASRGHISSDALRPLVPGNAIKTINFLGSDTACRSTVTQSVKEDVTTQSVVTRKRKYLM